MIRDCHNLPAARDYLVNAKRQREHQRPVGQHIAGFVLERD